MEIKVLRTFLMVADVGTVVEASHRLHCVQSNVTTRIKALEEELGVLLFHRSRNGMTLTAAGVVLQDHARRIVRAERDAVTALSTGEGGLLRIGSMESTLATRLPEHLAQFSSRHRGIGFDIKSGPTDELVGAVLRGHVDIAFIGGPSTHPDIVSEPIFAEEMMLASAEGIHRDAVRGARLFVFKAGCTYRAFAERWLRASGLGPNEISELGTLDGILGCVAAGVGVAVLPRAVIEASGHRRRIRLHEIDGPERFIDTYAIRRRDSPEEGPSQALLHMLRSEVNDAGPSSIRE